MSLSLVTAPKVEPVTLAEARIQCRMGDDLSEDALIDSLRVAARELVETETHRRLINAVVDWKHDGFAPCGFRLPLGGVSEITSITYVDANGVTQTLSPSLYDVDLPTGPQAQCGRIVPAYGQMFPSTRCQMNAVVIRMVAGYGATPASVPEGLKQAIKLLVGHWFANRESVQVGVGLSAVVVPQAIDNLLWQFKAF